MQTDTRFGVKKPPMGPKPGLSHYHPKGVGIPPVTETTHFTHILKPYSAKHGLSVNEFSERHNNGTIREPELDRYFLHDPRCARIRPQHDLLPQEALFQSQHHRPAISFVRVQA
jgi:neutral trehalase